MSKDTKIYLSYVGVICLGVIMVLAVELCK